MEPAAKRARHGRAPHDELMLPAMHYNSKQTGGGGGGGTDNDDEDEIAMDPEDYSMKENPQYRLEKFRAVADSKLKSAFELLFEKYSKDFGDTGDEVNFYTEEIEVDNGHIASLPVPRIPAEPKDGEGTDGSYYSDGQEDSASGIDGHSSSSHAVRKSVVRRQIAGYLNGEDVSRSVSLLSPGIGSLYEPKTVTLSDESIDPTWAAPALPETSFGSPRNGAHIMQPPRATYSVPHRNVFRKSLPRSFVRFTAAARRDTFEHRGSRDTDEDEVDDEDDVDDLIMDTSAPILTFNSAESTPQRELSNWAGPSLSNKTKLPPPPASVLRSSAAKSTVSSTKTTPSNIKSSRPRHQLAAGSSSRLRELSDSDERTPSPSSDLPPYTPSPRVILSPPRTTSVFALIGPPTPLPGSLPTPQDEDSNTGDDSKQPEKPVPATSKQPVETFSRNTLDSSFAFSDEEDFGLKMRRKKSVSPVSQYNANLPASPSTPKRTATVAASSSLPHRSAHRHTTVNSPAAQGEADTVNRNTTSRASPEAHVVKRRRLVRARPKNNEPSPEPPANGTANGSPHKELSPSPPPPPPPPKQKTPSPVKATRRETTDSPGYNRVVISLVSEDENEEDEQAIVSPQLDRTQFEVPDSSAYRSGIISLVSEDEDEEEENEQVADSAQQGRTRFAIPDSPGYSSDIMSLVSEDEDEDEDYEDEDNEDQDENEEYEDVTVSARRPGSSMSTASAKKAVQAGSSLSTPRKAASSARASSKTRSSPVLARTLSQARSKHQQPQKQPRYQSHVRPSHPHPAYASSPLLSRRRQTADPSLVNAPSPGGSLVQTPGGTMRRCGQNGFRCDRDFCFRCI